MKRVIALLLSISLVFGMLTLGVFSEEPKPDINYAGMGDYTVSLQADPTTDKAPTEFGTTAANGKVWVDKSVVVNQDHFEVTLSALAQEYFSESGQTSTSSVSADVVMVLDLSQSMQNNSLTLDNANMTRTKAMVKAVNETLEIIMGANSYNRVLIYTYQSDSNGTKPVINEFLPLGHYTNTSWSSDKVFSGNSGKYFDYGTSGSSGVVTTSANLKKDGSSFSKKSISTSNGTCTQHGILKGVQALSSAIAKETKSVDRKPYVLLFTDGAPGNVTKSWYNSSSKSCDFTHANSGDPEYSALTILSSAYMKDVLQTAYNNYNGKNLGIEWFNIGLGVGNSELGKLFLQPWTVATSTSDNAEEMRSHIASYTSGSYSSYASYGESYIYCVDSYIVDSGNDLEDAFTALAKKVEEETKVITSPIITTKDSVSDLVFEDTLGAGMSAKNLCLHVDESTEIFGVLKENVYSFGGYDMTATLATDGVGRTVLKWDIPADEVAIFSFANRTDPTDGEYVAAEPIRLTYDVSVDNPIKYSGETLYSNTAASVKFSVPNDNTYYFSDDGSFKNEAIQTQNKLQNITELSDYVTSYTYESIQDGASIVAALGNNGKLSPATVLEKTADETKVEAGDEVSFTLVVTNKGETDLSAVVITDTLPKGLSYKENSAQNAVVQEKNDALVFTIPAISVGETIRVTYVAVLSSDVAEGEALVNTAAITRINEIDVYGPVNTSTTVTGYHTHRVVYEWSGNIPSGQLLPTDSNRYASGAYYGVDTKYTSQTKIENKDKFGNVVERWSFSGWDDPQKGQMGNADVTIRGVWSYEAFQFPEHKITYSWSGDIPTDKKLPTDENAYIENQPYTVDNTYTAATVIETKDSFGNINGRYTFSGWADPNGGTMGNKDIVITGVWEYESVKVPSYKVIYTWSGDVPSGEKLPKDDKTYAPNQKYSLDETYLSETKIETKDSYGNVNGQYTFSGWNDPNDKVMGNADVTVSGVWSFQSVDVPEHRVHYVWSGEVPPKEKLPTDDGAYVKGKSYSVDKTYTDKTDIPTYDSFGNINGHYTFSGWTDPNTGVMGEEDVIIRGVWEYASESVPAHKVIYVWTGEIPPDEALPTDTNSYVKNQPYEVDSTYSKTTKITTYDSFGNKNGRYIFSGWTDPKNGVMGEEDVTVSGIWEYESLSVPSHKVIYTWSGDIPSDAVLPTDQNSYVKNQPYEVDSTYSASTVIPTYDSFGNMNGRYTFSGWTDPNSGIMGEEDITIPGIWEYESLSVPSYKVKYTWSGELPPEGTLPTDEASYVPNQPYSVDKTYTSETVIEVFDDYGNVNGRYTFSGWADPNGGIMGNADVEIPGVWSFEAVNIPAHRVIYTWSGTIPPTEVLPTDINSYVKNQPYSVDSFYTAETELRIYDAHKNLSGRYTFSGWTDPNNGVMGDADVTVSGVWSFESKSIPTHRVYYVWTGEIPPEAELPEDGNSYVKNQAYLLDKTYTAETEVLTYDADGNVSGKYTFSGWDDPYGEIMGEEDVIIEGVWDFETISPPAKDEPPKDEPPKEEPSEDEQPKEEPTEDETPKKEETQSQPDSPLTGESLPMVLFFAIWIFFASGWLLVGALKRKPQGKHYR